ncbi:SspB family protein [Sneathiella glossodoripedis]|uniref:SspB family protein n=1 Tax=Sneathiella glossodoripedis TaxID=418853 RepID=UPI00046EAB42|nr:ClpXP protease specificity-enhancing factor SspB [Sneathiella glossodoripedis]
MSGEINYNLLVERALINVVRDSLRHAAEHGLSGQQHFYITFKTHFDGVDIPAHLKERYKEEMTIVLQHQFWDLVVDETKFSLGLSFNHQRETLEIPFDAVTAFADPSVQFGLQFNLTAGGNAKSATASESSSDAKSDEEKPSENKAGEVITLDAFRKN